MSVQVVKIELREFPSRLARDIALRYYKIPSNQLVIRSLTPDPNVLVLTFPSEEMRNEEYGLLVAMARAHREEVMR